MGKKACSLCNKELGLLAVKTPLADGIVCSNCLKSIGIITLPNSKSHTVEGLKNIIADQVQIKEKFNPKKQIAALKIDDENMLFSVGNEIFHYENLLNFELIEDGETITKGGLGRAVAGGLVFGAAGAIVGGVTGKKTKSICNSMKINITLKNTYRDNIYINLITSETKKSSIIYKASQTNAQNCISALQIIADINNQSINQTSDTSIPISEADEILKFKQLLDLEIISQEEFEQKKKQLLGL